jgi:hypothetical protein
MLWRQHRGPNLSTSFFEKQAFVRFLRSRGGAFDNVANLPTQSSRAFPVANRLALFNQTFDSCKYLSRINHGDKDRGCSISRPVSSIAF